MTDLRDAMLDLLLGARCVGCAAPGRMLCASCAAYLPEEAQPSRPTPCPPGLAPAFAGSGYDGVVQALVLGHKEHGLLSLRAPLAGLLAAAVRAIAPTGPIVLVPVPSRPSSVRARGHDPTWAMTVRASDELGLAGWDVRAARLLRPRPGLEDQSGLDATARAANLAGSLWCPSAAVRRLARRQPRARLVVCDDVLTTGATAREAQRALTASGLEVAGIAVAAATARRRQRVAAVDSAPAAGRVGEGHNDSSGGSLSRNPSTH